MQAFVFRREVNDLLQSLDEAEDFMVFVGLIANSSPGVDVNLAQICEGGDKASSAVANLRNTIGGAGLKLRAIDFRKFFSSLEVFQARLKKVGDYKIGRFFDIEKIIDAVDVVSERFVAFLSSGSLQNTVLLISDVRCLENLLVGFKSALLFAAHGLEEPRFDLEEKGELAIFLHNSMNLAHFSAKLHAVDECYLELCALTGVSPTDYPLQIGKIESGSLWVKVFGEPRVIGLLVDFIECSVSFIYRNFSNEGKLTAIPRKIEALDSVINLSGKLQGLGVDVVEMNDYIRKSAVVIAKDLNVLLDGQVEVTVNGRTHSVGDEIQKHLVDLKKPLSLSYEEDKTEVQNLVNKI